MLTIQDIKDIIIDKYDPDDIVEALEISTEELLDAFENKLELNLYKFDGDLEE